MATHVGLHNIYFTADIGLADRGVVGRRRTPIEARFWSKVNKEGPLPADVSLGRCWLWMASQLGRDGYGQFVLPRNADGKQEHVYAHRFAYELAHGPIPVGLSVLHKCDVPGCVRDSHLFLGTQQDNLDDARRKGRLVDGLAARKLSDAAYADILSSSETGVALAARHAVHKNTISRIRNGRQGVTYQRAEALRSQAQQSVGPFHGADRAVQLG